MAIPVNLAFLVPQAMMKGFAKLTFWDRSVQAVSMRLAQGPLQCKPLGDEPVAT